MRLLPLSGLSLAPFLTLILAHAAPPAREAVQIQKTDSASHPAASPAAEKTQKWVFSLLPKSFQKNPSLDLAVITEVTDEGRKRRTATAENPEYFISQASGFHAEGHGNTSEQLVAVERLTAQLDHALASQNFLRATPDHRATLALFYAWGVHNKVDAEDGFQDVGYKNLLSRAQLVGGKKFADELLKALNDDAYAIQGGIQAFRPLQRFIERDDLTRQLMEQIFDDVYYLVVSAYDVQDLLRGERKLLWRTKMTTAAQGVGLNETMPALVSSGAQYFGRDMTAPTTAIKRIQRGGKVELGPAEVKEYIDTPEPNAAPPASKKSP